MSKNSAHSSDKASGKSNKASGKISITVLLASAIGALVALAVGVVLVISVLANFRNTTELMQVSANQTIDALERHLDTQLQPARRVVEHIARQAGNGDIDITDKRELIATMRAALGTTSNLSGLSIIQPNGREIRIRRTLKHRFVVESIDNSADDFATNFLKSIKKSTKATWSAPLRIDGFSFLSISAPIYKGNTLLGVVSAGITIGSLSNTIASIENKTKFTGFVLYGDNYVLAHKNIPNLSKAKLNFDSPLHHIDDVNDPILAQFAKSKIRRELDTNGFEVRNMVVKGVPFLSLSRPIKKYGVERLHIGVHVGRAAVNGQLTRMFTSFAAGLMLLVLAIIAAILLARRVSTPIKKISKAATRVGALDLQKIRPLASSRIRELDQQALAFNQMIEALKWFEAYVPARLVRKLIAQKDGKNVVASRQVELTVMFTDIIGFTAMSENLSPADTAAMLNEHFECLNGCIDKTDGTLDKYIGDAIMAFWGAPDTQEDHALRACETAMCVIEKLATIQSDIRIKIAIHSGPLIVGNIGSKARMNYTVIGDTVNTCARLEKIAGEIDDGSAVNVVMSDITAKAIDSHFNIKLVGDYQVKGREKTVTVYRLISRK